MRFSPLVRINRSGSGMPAVVRQVSNSDSLIAVGSRRPMRASRANSRAAAVISCRAP